jgi:hypothetical protein
MDLVRRMLLAIEASDEPDLRTVLEFDDVEPAKISHHFHVLTQAGLVAIVERGSHGSDYLDVYLTWQGYEFLDAIRDPRRWADLQERAAMVGVGSAAMLMELSRAAAIGDARRLGLAD